MYPPLLPPPPIVGDPNNWLAETLNFNNYFDDCIAFIAIVAFVDVDP